MQAHNYFKNVVLPQWAQDLFIEGENRANKINTAADAYARVPLVMRALDLRCDALASVPVYIGDVPAEEADLNLYYPLNRSIGFYEFLWLLEASYLLRGGALAVVLANGYSFKRGIQFINPFTVHAEYADGEERYYQIIDGKRYPATGFWIEGKDAHFIRKFSPLADVGFGVSATETALGDAQMMHYLARFASKFFEGGAMPLTLINLPSGTSDAERDRTENFFKRAAQGISNAWRVLAVRSSQEIKPSTYTPNFKDMALTDIRNQAIDAVAWAFNVPRTMLTADAANYATANQDANGFLSKTIVPRCNFYARELRALGINVRFAPEEMSELQADENERASAVGAYVNALQDPRRAKIAFALLGVDVPPDVQAMIDALDNANAPKEATEQETETETETANEETSAVQDELRKWKRKAIKRFEQGKSALVPFESETLDSEQMERIRIGLAAAKSKSDVEVVFRAANAGIKAIDRGAAERTLARAIAAHFANVWEWTADKIEKGGSVDLTQISGELRRIVENELLRTAREAALAQAESIGVEFDPAAINEVAARWARDYSYDLIKDLDDRTRAVVQDALTKWQTQAGMTRGDLTELLRPAFGRDRAEMIAVTETTRAFAQAQRIYQDLLAEQGVKMMRVWNTDNDDLVCPICRPLNGQTENENGKFESIKGEIESPPAHVNCRCSVGLRLKR